MSIWRGGYTELKDRFTSNPFDRLSFIVSVVSLAAVSAQPLFAGRVKEAAVMSVLTIGISLFLFRKFTVLRPPRFDTSTFTGIRPLTDPWPRDAAFKEISERIRNTQKSVVFVSGRSGAGKSTLFEKRIVPGARSEDWLVVYVDEYRDIAETIWRALGLQQVLTLESVREFKVIPAGWLPDAKPCLFVFDQLEQLTATTETNVEWLRVFCRAMNACDNVRVAAVVRQEFYYALRILKELVPAPAEVYEMPDLDLSRLDEDTRSVISRLDEIAVEEVAKSIRTNVVPTSRLDEPAAEGGRILPLEMQIIGEALNRHFLLNDSIRVPVSLFQRIGGTREALVRDYFEYYVERSPDRDLAPAVLFALAVAPPPQVLRTDDVCRLTYAFPRAVDGLLQFFERDCGLLRKRGGGYQWVHESLAAMYVDATPTDMLPALPEAIRYHAQHRATGFHYDSPHIQPLLQISTAVFTAMIATIAVSFVYALWTSSALKADSYLLAAPAHAAFAVFVYRFVISFVVRLHRTAAIASWLFIASFGAISIGITIAKPETWIASMGLTGGVIGVTLLLLSRRHRRPLAGKHVGTAGWTFAFLGVTMILAGSAYAALVQAHLFGLVLPWAGAAASLAFVAIAATSTHRYATAGAGATWLSYIERP